VKFGVIVFPGSNCDHDAYHVISKHVGQPVDFIWHGDTDLSSYDAVIIPGGFSYGDYLRAGALARFSPIMASVKKFAAQGGYVLGICNGFQILLEAGLLPGAMMRNSGLRYICRHVFIRVEQTDTPFTSGASQGQVLKVLYRTGSGPNSCFTCVADGATAPACLCNTSGGAEFYADFANGKVIEYAFLSYWVRFGDVNEPFDWGLAGKMPGLSGGIPVHGLNIVNGSGFTARGMWRPNVCGAKSAELYWYGLPVGSSNTDQCGTGPSWNWQADAKWHQVQMQLKMSTGVAYNGTMQLWYDKPVTATPDINVSGLGMLDRTKFPMNSVSQLMFSTFYGGHDNTWGPKTDTHAYFADFQICN